MPTTLLFTLLVLSALAGAACSYWTIVLVQIFRTRALLPTARHGLSLPRDPKATPPHVAIIIPAHNERNMLPRCAQSLLAQDWPSFTIVFALDRCTDGTADVLRESIGDDPRCTIHEIAACPPDWAGKVHAVWSALHAVPAARSADLYLFADADTTFEPACVRACVNLLEARRLDLLSLLSTLDASHWFERFVQPAAGMELLRQYPPLRVNRPRDQARPFANGQFMLFRRDAYERTGGHEAVKSELLEDIVLARHIWRIGGTGGLLFADGLLHCKMYETWAQFRRGWKRIYTESANRHAGRLQTFALRLFATGVFLPAASALALPAGLITWLRLADPLGLITFALGLAALLLMLAAQLGGARLGRSSPLGALFYPLGALLTAGILRDAARDLSRGRATEWAGRSYARPSRTRP